ncbi:PAS domain-containing protein [Streptomyces sp. NPDC006872]|uniref:PAS domain-containing protein n=1 Tax=Streptomyces sp. NPDC006872 TaxID=3155720 RepID=UPI0033F467A8
MGGSGRKVSPLTGVGPDVSVSVAVTDRDGRVTFWSEGAESVLGYSPAEIIGRPMGDLAAADGRMGCR